MGFSSYFYQRYGVAASAGTLSALTGTIVLSNSNGVSFGASSDVSGATITMSASVGGGNLRSISASSTFATGPSAVFSNSNAVSFGANGQTVTAGLLVASYWDNRQAGSMGSWSVPGASSTLNMTVQRTEFALPVIATRADLLASMTVGGSTAGSFTISLGIYTMAGSTASLASSASVAVTWNSGTNSTAASIYGGQSNLRPRSIGLGTWNISMGDYLLAAIVSISGVAGSTAGMSEFGFSRTTLSNVGGGNFALNFGNGLLNAGTAALPASIHLTAINQTLGAQVGVPYLQLAGTF